MVRFELSEPSPRVGFHEPKVEDLDEVMLQAAPGEENIRRLEIAMYELVMMSLGQRLTDLQDNVDDPLARKRSVSVDQRLEIEPLE